MSTVKKQERFPQKIKRGSAVVKIYYTPSRGRDFYTVSYWLGTQRKRLTFSELAVARSEAERVATQLAVGDVDLAQISRSDWACYLRAKQLSNAAGVPLDSLAAQFLEATQALGPIPLRQAVDYYLKKHPKNLQPKLVKDVISEMLEVKRQDGLNRKYLQHLRSDLKQFAKAFSGNLSTITGSDIDFWLRSLGVAGRTRNNLRTSVKTLFSYAKSKRYLPKDHDELDAVPIAKTGDGDVEVFTPFEMESLLDCADEGLIPFLALGGFAGIRHAEIQRLTWDEVSLDDNWIEIRAGKAKTASRRIIPVSENLREWLLPMRKTHGVVCPYKNVSNKITKLVRKVNAAWKAQGVERTFRWKHNALRHSFISYRIAQIKNVPQVALEAGNSPQIIHRHYKELVRRADAEKWFSIVPPPTGQIIHLPALNAIGIDQQITPTASY